MSHKLLVIALVALTLLTGCIPSLNPVYRESDLIFDPALVGVWKQKGEKSRWIFTKRDETSYSLRYVDEHGREGCFVAHLANLEGDLFLDLFPEPRDDQVNSFHSFHQVPIHSIYRVYRTQPTVEIGAIDFQWLQSELSKESPPIQSSNIHGRCLVTASTDDVRAFSIKNKDRFSAAFALERAATPR